MTGTPVDDQGDPVEDSNDAEVEEISRPDVVLEKTVLAGPEGACPGVEGDDELVSGEAGSPVTLDDPDLGITQDDMVLVAGDDTVPLESGAELVYAYEATI